MKMTAVFEEAFKYYITNVNIIKGNKVYTYFPYNNSCGSNYDPILISTCKNAFELYPNKLPKNLNGCKIKMLAQGVEPFVLNVTLKNRSAREGGLEVKIMNTIAEKYNFSENYLEHNESVWGFRLKDGSYTGHYKKLIERKADLFFGIAPPDYHEDFDLTTMHLIEQVTWWVPIANFKPRWRNIIDVYRTSIWILMVIALVLITVIWKFIGIHLETSVRYKELFLCFMIHWHSLLQGSVLSPKSGMLRFLFILWILFSIVLSCSYQSQLISFLTKPLRERQISNTKELIESKMRLAFSPKAAEIFFNNPDDPVHRYITTSNYLPCPLGEICVNRTAFQRDVATFKSERQISFLMKTYYLDSNGKPLIYGFKDANVMTAKFVLRKGYPLLEIINDMLLRLRENGLIRKWDKDVTNTNNFSDKEQLVALSILHLYGAYACLLVGNCSALIVFICEIIFKKYGNK